MNQSLFQRFRIESICSGFRPFRYYRAKRSGNDSAVCFVRAVNSSTIVTESVKGLLGDGLR